MKIYSIITLLSFKNLPTDEPPFNFQGMLRKTTYNRSSMKRTTAGKLSISQGDLANNNVSGNSKTIQKCN